MIEVGDEVNFIIHSNRLKIVSGITKTRHIKTGIVGIFNAREVFRSLVFKISVKDYCFLKNFPNNSMRISECDGLDFSITKSFFEKPELKLNRNFAGAELIIPEPVEGSKHEQNQKILIDHIKAKDSRKLNSIVKDNFGMVIKKQGRDAL